MAKTPIDARALPVGLSKKELIKSPELKQYRSWFNWAAWVQIITGILNLSTVGQLAEYQAQGYLVDESYMLLLGVISLVFIVLGVVLLISKSTTVAYIVGVTGILFAVYALATGGSVGAGIVGTVLALVGAVKYNKLWKEYCGL